ncbi:unnamed protein product (macronuclear) [Paramecium tetraurelia]|uniref:Uncharacterized protein n=1 Tax=Paramecium tetraurelia TaxID=5888 RepID=A0DNG1_PARTE|nr:uncharacterized protein GSPATT00018774001 [Paramecium tetraurelia]CAK84578.1 unnamed protein product [Paramecium tetraurelia]|eukprot:XP_001451975.1 hypothetical protein (macronuclear) [Paramecium tetraurelia strain d4-2]
MVESNKKLHTLLSISNYTTSYIDSFDPLNQSNTLIGIDFHNYIMLHKKCCPKCLIFLELFTSKKDQTFQCTNCQWMIELKITLLYTLVNCLQITLMLSLFPIIAFALSIQKTEDVMQRIERKIDSITIIIIVNLLFSIPMFILGLIICLFLAPYKILLAFSEAVKQRDFNIIKRVFS